MLALSCVALLTLASCATSGSSSDGSSNDVAADTESAAAEAASDAPIELLPIVDAFTSKVLAPWEAASSVFLPESLGGLKWETLKRFQRNQIQEGNYEPVFFWTSEKREDWTVLRFCSDELSEGECSEYDESPELHVFLEGGQGRDLKWFQDEGKGPVEASFFSVSSSNTDFPVVDFGVNSGLTLLDWSGTEVSCFFGEVVINPELIATVEEVWFSAYSDMRAQSIDGVSVEASSPSTGIIETRSVAEPIPYVACFEYPADSIESLLYAAGEFRLTILGDRKTNTDDVEVSLEISRI
jgi:hypothetical protein